tara:strand:+ start:249 stop:911 length:663 start_codon:yes stop_codon:yes gene_type:complete
MSNQGLSVSDLRALDDKAKKLGLDERLLIENASSNLFTIIDSLNLGKKVVVVSGRGNNGADVLSCSRKLLSRGYAPQVIVLENKPLGNQAQFQKSILEKIGVSPVSINEKNIKEFKNLLANCDFILEGILGIGLKGQLDQFFKTVISLINESNKPIVSCDIPSGLSADRGVILDVAVKADYTVSFIAPKKGFFLADGPKICGKIFVVDIGISRQVLEKSK